MTSLGKGIGIGLVVIAAAQVSASAATQPRHHSKAAVTHHKSAAAPLHKAAARAASLPAPRQLANRIDELGRGFSGRVGIAVKSIDDGWETGWRNNDLYPQQCVSKLWVSITTPGAVDRGRIDLGR